MADDMCFNLVHAQELIRNQACDLISVYPGKNGGIRKSREIALYADDLKTVGVLNGSTDSNRFASRVFSDVLV